MTFRLDFISDIHIDWYRSRPQHRLPSLANLIDLRHSGYEPGSAALLVAGDISDSYADVVEYLQEAARLYRSVLFVDGNHDFYGERSVPERMADLAALTEGTSIHYLPARPFEHAESGTAVVGVNGWHDFDFTPHLCGKQECEQVYYRVESKDRANLRFAGRVDELAAEQAAALRGQLDRYIARGMRIIVVTHTPPTPDSLDLSPAKVARMHLMPGSLGSSHLRRLLAEYDKYITAWIHGHEHGIKDYRHGNVRILSNARGYPWDSADRCCVKSLRF